MYNILHCYQRLQDGDTRCFDSLPKPMADVLYEMLDPTVLLNKGMLLLSVANVIGMIGFYVPIIFTTPRAEALGVSKTDAAFLLSIMGEFSTGCVNESSSSWYARHQDSILILVIWHAFDKVIMIGCPTTVTEYQLHGCIFVLMICCSYFRYL